MKNILVLFLSNWHNGSTTYHYKICDADGKTIRTIDGNETNEPYIKYLMEELNSQGQDLTHVYMICSDDVMNKKDYNKFSTLVRNYCESQNYSIPTDKIIRYHEEGNNSKKAAMDAVLELSEKFQEDCASCKESDISVYVDFAGGMRDTALLMTAVLRLFAFQDIEVKQIMYANLDNKNRDNPNGNHHLSDLTDIYHLYDLVAGAEEFTSFGSVENLQYYYKNRNTSSELGDLLNAMERFSKDLKLCAFGRFEQTIETLRNALDSFSQNKAKSEDDQIFDILVKRIEKEYDSILKDDADLLDYIRWCIENDYIQQALTLLSEILPTYVVTGRKIVYPKHLFSEDGTLNEEDEWKKYMESYLIKKGLIDFVPWESTFFSRLEELRKHRQIKDKNIEDNVIIEEEIVFGEGYSQEEVKEIRRIQKDIHRNMRNKINHASELKNMTYDETKEVLKNYCKRLTEIIKKGQTNVH